MNILVKGGAGYIGGTVATLRIEAGHEVTVLDNFCHGKRDTVPAGVHFMKADMAIRAAVESALHGRKTKGGNEFRCFDGGR